MSEINLKKGEDEKVNTKFTQSVKNFLKDAGKAEQALIAAVRYLESFYAEKFKDVKKAELAGKTMNLYLKLRLAEAEFLREITKKVRE